ncbi:MAG: drug resistance transporter [Acidimicrobiales bacterium]|nr:drug resistance transporter [Acidimicrobiales bacterium]
MKQLTPAADRRWAALAVLCVALIVVTMDTTILNVALPSLVRDLHAGASGLAWIVDGYTLVFAGLLLTAGSLGDRYGRRGAFGTGLALFAAASAASALAGTTGQLVAMRALTGVGAALVFPATLSILIHVFTDPQERQKAIAVWAGTAGIGIGLGPVAGGFLLRHFSWGSVFWVNVPLCLLALVGARFLLPPSDRTTGKLDPKGAALSIAGLGALVYGIIEGPDRGWSSSLVLGSFAVALVAFASFVAVELGQREPMLDLRLFRNPRFSAASLSVTTLYFALFGVIFFQTQHLQFVLGYDPLGAGLRSLPFAVVLLVVANTTPRLVARAGTRAVIVTGLSVVAAAMLLRTQFDAGSTYAAIFWNQCLFALGMGLTIAPATASIMGSVPPERAGVGSAINDTTRQVGGALGVAVMGSVGSSAFRRAIDADSVGSAIGAGLNHKAVAQAFVHGQNVAALIGFAVVTVGAIGAWRFLPRQARVVVPSVPMELAVEVDV